MPKIEKRTEKQKAVDARKKRNEKRKTQPTKQAKYKDESGKLHEDVKKLEVEQVFECMPELFDTLDMYYPESWDSQKAAVKRVKRHILVERKDKSQKIEIKDIYEEPIEWVDKRDGKNASIYTPYLKALLIYRLLQAEDHEYTLEWSYPEFWENLGMRNKYYTDYDVRENLPAFDKEITEVMLDHFFKWTGSKNRSITDYILDSLKDEELLDYEKYLAINENHKVRKATEDEVICIRSEKKRIMKEWGLRTKQDVFLANKSRELHKEVKKNTGLNYFDMFKIYILDKDVLEDGLLDNLNDCQKLNQLIIDSDLRSAKKRVETDKKNIDKKYEEDKKKMAIGKPQKRSPYFLYMDEDEYLGNFRKLEEYFTELKVKPERKSVMRQTKEFAEEQREKKLKEYEEEKKEKMGSF